MTKPFPIPPLRWITNTPAVAVEFLESGRFAGYLLETDFPICADSLAPYVTTIFDALAPLEAHEIPVGLISIKQNKVRIF
jgi:hypothetical protein